MTATHHLLLHEHAHAKAQHIRWPSFKGLATEVGSSPSNLVTVYYDEHLGPKGLKNASDLLVDADRIVRANDAIFQTTQSTPVNVIVFALGGATDGSGGADHLGCDYKTGGNIEVCASFGDSMRCSALFEAELAECAMNNTLCGLSTGEALSRWAASAISNNALSDFATAPDWVAKGYPNFVDKTDSTDQNGISVGCGMAFISWVLSKGVSLTQIAVEMVSLGDKGVLAAMGSVLLAMPQSTIWDLFLAEAKVIQITTDDPFNVASA